MSHQNNIKLFVSEASTSTAPNKFARNINDSLLIGCDMKNDETLAGGAINNSILIHSDPVSFALDDSTGDTKIGSDALALYSNAYVANNATTMYDSSARANSIAAWNSVSHATDCISMWHSTIHAKRNSYVNHIALWDSDISNATTQEISLWNNKVKIKADGSINGVIIFQYATPADGTFPHYGMTYDNNTVYII